LWRWKQRSCFHGSRDQQFTDHYGDVVPIGPIGPIQWGVVAEHHKELFGAKNRDVTSL
jgi:hypothetical protein